VLPKRKSTFIRKFGETVELKVTGSNRKLFGLLSG
jgi:hypothetical protein